jgi:phosphonate transport system substrate-binding protein
MTFDNSPEQLATIKTGAITLLALHAADVPYVVNNFGFQPVAVLGNDGGANGNHLDIIVPADSPITSPAMLAGHTLTCTVPSSITGYRAAIALLAQMNNLRPNADYLINWSLKQKLSIQGIVDKKYEAAAVSDDSLQTELRNGTLQANSYKNIFASDVIPRTTIGYFYDLKPDLAAKVQAAIKAYAYHDPNDTLSKDLKFLPVDYKTDFKLVREIDDRFDPRFDSKPKKATDTPTDTPAPDATATPPATTPATPPPK